MSQTIKPGDDFYGYVNDAWLAAHPIPPQKAHIGVTTVLADENFDRLKVLLDAPEEHGEAPGIKHVKRLYRLAMDTASIERAGLSMLNQTLQDIRSFSNAEELKHFVGSWHQRGFDLIWHTHLDVDDKDSSQYKMRISQSGLGLPDRDYYFDTDTKFGSVRKNYLGFVTKLLELLGVEDAPSKAEEVYRLEMLLADKSDTAVERRDVLAHYNSYERERFGLEYTNFPWEKYFKHIGAASVQTLLVSQPEFLMAATRLLDQESIESWRYYCMVHCLLPVMPVLPKAYEKLHFNFYAKVLAGAKEQEPRYRRAINMCMHLLPEPIGQLFVEAHFDEDAKAAIYELVDHIKLAFRNRIHNLTWMSDVTKNLALEKLDTFMPLLGYPDSWRDYSELSLGESYVNAIMATKAFEWQYDIDRLPHSVDRKEWLMSPALVNAYYWPNTNGITFPAGILQSPFFDSKGDFAANYGAIGAVIGHEITHGFDDQGALFDKVGKLHSWWSEKDWAAFNERTQQLVAQYDAYELQGEHVSGELTLGENIADLGGTLIAYDALQKKLETFGERALINGLTPEQRFFISFAKVWRENMRPELTLHLLVTNPHAPNVFRVNGVVTNIDAFYEVFDIQPGDKLYKAPDKRVKIW